MLGFIRSDLAKLKAYTPHPGGESGKPVEEAIFFDRIDSNESPFDLPVDLKEKLAWTYQQQIEANRYPDGSHLTLSEAIAQYVKGKGKNATPDALAQITQEMRAIGSIVRHTGGGLRITVGSIEENARTLQRLQTVLAHY